MNVEKIIRGLSEDLTGDQITSLVSLRRFVEALGRKEGAELFELTDHSIRHNDAILPIVTDIIRGQQRKLSAIEAYILVAAIYLHDIGQLIWPGYDRRQHSSLSVAIIRQKEFLSAFGAHLPFLTFEIAEEVALVCYVHNRPEALAYLISRQEVGNEIVRLRLLGALLILGDSFQAGKGRVMIENLGKAQRSLGDRLFWYRYSSVESVDVSGASIHLLLAHSADVARSIFKKFVERPVIQHFENLLAAVNSVFTDNEFTPLRLRHSVATSESAGTDATAALLKTVVLENEIRRRNQERRKAIQGKLKRRGLIKRSLADNELLVLRRWSSYTPRMPSWNNFSGQALPMPYESRGGGYFLIWRKTGIVIDPGYDFLRNFWSQRIQGNDGFELDDINAVIISHAHDDHSHDIEPIVSLYHKSQKAGQPRRPLHLYLSEGTHIKYERLLTINGSTEVVDLIPGDGITGVLPDGGYLGNRGITLEFIRTKHNEVPWMLNHTGIALKIHLSGQGENVTIGYTSDTRYSDDLAPFFRDANMLLLHLGNIGPKSSSSDPYDSNHLGLNGCHDMITNLRTSNIRLFLLDEFGEEEIGNDRIRLCDFLGASCSLASYGKVLLPMDIGMRVRLPTLEVFCQEQNHNHFVPYDQIIPHLPSTSDGIVYYCHLP
jgi:hypothetical protein